MKTILLVLGSADERERIRAALGERGLWVTAVGDRQGALRAAADQAPDLVLVSSEVEGASALVKSFGTRNGGPGALLLAPADRTEEAFEIYEAGADRILSQPVRARDLIEAVEQGLAAPRDVFSPGPAASGRMFTAQEIFGDVLAEVERDGTEEPAAAEPPAVAPPPEPSPGPPPAPAEEAPSEEAVPSPTPPVEAPPPPEPRPERAPEPVTQEASEPVAEKARPPAPEEASEPVAEKARPPAPEEAAEPVAEKAQPPAMEQAPEPVTEKAPEPVTEKAPPPARTAAPPAAPSAPPERPPAASAAAESAAEPVEPPVAAAAAEPPAEPVEPPVAAAAAEPPAESVEPPVAASPAPGHFGQYELVERIAVGGMAEVWKARMSGVEGFRKTVAIKKILPHLAESRDFVTMFIDEAKLAAELSHENIVNIYDLGKIGQDYFIAMEHVEGRDLRSILNAARQRDVRLPLGLSLMIAARLASALDHAHRRRSGDGALGLVHRDVSPRNVLISREGHVKLCDFGVAKAASTVARTQVGVLKGKLEYMSPEQASGGAVDGRSDVFSLGALLFEMVAGEPLFSAEGEIALLEVVRSCRVRTPRAVDPALPREVDRIVARALRKEPAKRFPTAGEMQRQLEAGLRELGSAPGTEDLASWVEELFAAPVPAAAPAAETGSEAAAEATVEPPAEHAEERRRRRRWIAAAVAALAALALGLAVLGLLRESPADEPAPAQPAPEAAAAATVEPPPAGAASAPEGAIDVEEIVDRELERREAELREAFLEEERRLQRELERLESEAGRESAPPPP